MANPLIGMAGGTPGAGMNMGVLQQAKQAMGMLRAMKNPQQALQMIAQQSPDSAAILQAAQGRNPVELFREECQKHGIDANQVMNMLGLTPPQGC